MNLAPSYCGGESCKPVMIGKPHVEPNVQLTVVTYTLLREINDVVAIDSHAFVRSSVRGYKLRASQPVPTTLGLVLLQP